MVNSTYFWYRTLARALFVDFGQGAVETWVEAQSKWVVAERLADSAKPLADHLLADVRLEASRSVQHVVGELVGAIETGWEEAAWERRSEGKRLAVTKAAEHAVAKWAQLEADGPAFSPQIVGEIVEGASESLRGYSELFPRNAERATQKGARVAERAVAMSFARASISSKTRGVLIGRVVPYLGPDVISLEARLSEEDAETEHLVLFAMLDGGSIEIGRFPAGIVNQALRYAADGRVIAATMVNGDGRVVGLATHLHPVLEDTPLGCRILEADRFVDALTSDDARSWLDAADFRALGELRKFRRAIGTYVRLVQLADYSIVHDLGCVDTHLQPTQAERDELNLEPFRAQTERFLASLDNNTASGALLEDAFQCTADREEDVGGCICGITRRQQQPYWTALDETSQVRERNPGQVRGAGLLVPPTNTRDYVEFWLHATFAVRGGDDSVAESTTVAMNYPPDYIDVLNEVLVDRGIDAYVRDGLDPDGFPAFMRSVEQFVFLQRLFRLAFQGSLGAGFDLQALVDLERETAEFVSSQTTVKWDLVSKDGILTDESRGAASMLLGKKGLKGADFHRTRSVDGKACG